MRRLESSGVKIDTIYDIYQVSFVKSGLTSHADEDESCIRTTREQNVTINRVNNANISTFEDTVFTKDSEHNLSFILSETGKNSPSDWDECELNFCGKHRLPFIYSVKRKMSNKETLALIKSSVSTCSRVPQACRRNAVFVVNTEYVKDLNDVKSDLNGSFQNSLESKWKTVEFESGKIVSVKVVSNKKQQLKEN